MENEDFFSSDDSDDLIKKANSVPIKKILNFYKIKLPDSNKTICPFTNHKNGKESTPSFYVYEKDNTFFCFGCRSGKRPIDFVSQIENIHKDMAAAKINKIFIEDIKDDFDYVDEDIDEKQNIFFNFSNNVRNFREDNRSERSSKFIEKISKTFDYIYQKHNLSNDGLLSLVEELTKRMENFIDE